MGAIDTNQYERRLKKARDTFEREVQSLADEVRRDLVVPACQKHGLEFLSGNGTYYFCSSDWNGGSKGTYVPDAIDARELGLDDLVPVFNVLDMEIDSNSAIGHYVPRIAARAFGDNMSRSDGMRRYHQRARGGEKSVVQTNRRK